MRVERLGWLRKLSLILLSLTIFSALWRCVFAMPLTIQWFNDANNHFTDAPVFSDINGSNALSAGVTNVVGDGYLLALVALQGGTNYVLTTATVGDRPDAIGIEQFDGIFNVPSLIPDDVLRGAVGAPLGVQFFNSTSAVTATSYGIVSNKTLTVPSPDGSFLFPMWFVFDYADTNYFGPRTTDNGGFYTDTAYGGGDSAMYGGGGGGDSPTAGGGGEGTGVMPSSGGAGSGSDESGGSSSDSGGNGSDGAGFFGPESGSYSCPITNAAERFFITKIVRATNSFVTITWQSCPEIYEVYSTDALSTQMALRATMIGQDTSTSWQDTNTVGVAKRFYKVGRLMANGDEDGDGLNNLDEFLAGTNPRSSTVVDTDGDGLSDDFEKYVSSGNATNVDPLADAEGDGYSNWDEALMASDPKTNSDPITVYVDNMNTNGVWDGTQTHPFRYIQDAIECSVPVNANLAIRVRPGNYYETVSNLHVDFYGTPLSKRNFLYIYAANNDWSLSTDPETHIIDSSGLPNGDVLGDSYFGPAPAVQFYDVKRARLNGFTVRSGKGINAGGVECISTQGVVTISNCIIENNGDPASSLAGGMLFLGLPKSLIYNTVVAKNAGSEAGGIDDYSGVRMWNCTVISNQSSTVGGIYGYNYSSVRNCAIRGNGLDAVLVDINYSTFGSNEFVTAGSSNLTNDPVLVNIAFGNYRLQTNSPMINAGTTLPIEKRDLYGNARPVSSAIDIGANEFKDTDGDGMQDDWETKHSLNPNSAADATTNLDSDAWNNLIEYNRNTDPRNSDTDGDGIADASDSDPTTPSLVITAEMHSFYRQSTWRYYVNGVTDPSWINQPPSAPRILKFNNYQIGDQFRIQLQYLSGSTGDPLFFLVPLQSSGAFSVLPDANATPLLQVISAAPLGDPTPPGGWTTTVWRATTTNADVCAGFDDETPKIDGFGDPFLFVPQFGTNTLNVLIYPTNVVSQVIFEVNDPDWAAVTPSQASSATQQVQISSLYTNSNPGGALTKLEIKGYGAQNSYTTTSASVWIRILPKATNATIAIYRIISASMTNNPPSNVPSAISLKSYLDQLYGTQANVFMNVLPLQTVVTNYDLNANGGLDLSTNASFTAEMSAITNAAYASNVINVYYVNAISNVVPQPAGGTYSLPKVTFIQDSHQGSSENVTAHELGHQLGLNYEVPTGAPGNTDRLMWGASQSNNPCRLIDKEWTTVNQRAQ